MKKTNLKKLMDVRVLAYMGMLIALNVVLTRFIPVIQYEYLRVSFNFIPVSFGSMLFGPVIGGLGAALSDLLGMLIASKGDYFPGLTLSAFLTGAIYGMFLYRKPKSMVRIVLAVLCISVFVNLGLNTYWFTILLGKGFMVMLPERSIQNGIMSIIQIIMIPVIWHLVGKRVEKTYLREPAGIL
jgi:ECF transporter S component (folate family)